MKKKRNPLLLLVLRLEAANTDTKMKAMRSSQPELEDEQ